MFQGWTEQHGGQPGGRKRADSMVLSEWVTIHASLCGFVSV